MFDKTQMGKSNTFPTPFQCYLPPHFKVYGTICVSPANKILLVKGRQSGLWSFPKGHMETGERALQCALRELHEETGLRLRVQPISYKKYGSAGYYIFAVPEEYRLFPQDSHEISEARWFSMNEIAKLRKNVGVSLFCRHLTKAGLYNVECSPGDELPNHSYPMSALSS